MVLCLSDGYGGLELYAAREVKQLQRQGHYAIAVVAQHSMLDSHLREGGIIPLSLKVTNRRLPLLAAKKLAHLIDEHQIDIVHIHWNNDLNLAVLGKIFSRGKPKLIYSRHMAITRSKKDPLHRWFYNKVDRMIVVTRLMQQEAETYLPLPADRVSQLYLGVADVDDKPADYQNCYDENFPRRQLNVALFGRIEPYKGQHLLISAVSELVKEGVDISATIVGHVMDKIYAAELQQNLTANSLDAYIKFESFVRNPVQRMKCYDVIILTTTCETFGLVLVEAMRAGIMVIGTNAGGVKEIISDKETGLLFEPGNAQQLKAQLLDLYRQPEKISSMAIKGNQRAEMLFSETTHFAELESILSSTLAQTG
jgi:glycosyltransferase involved in cell wall biosynthesis